jgi:hypothetical protein
LQPVLSSCDRRFTPILFSQVLSQGYAGSPSGMKSELSWDNNFVPFMRPQANPTGNAGSPA